MLFLDEPMLIDREKTEVSLAKGMDSISSQGWFLSNSKKSQKYIPDTFRCQLFKKTICCTFLKANFSLILEKNAIYPL